MSDSKVEDVVLDELKSTTPGKPVFNGNPLDLVKDVKVQLRVVLGDAQVSVAEFMALKEKSIVPLEQKLNEPVDILLDGKVVARGNLVAVDDQFGIQITEVNN